MNRVGLYENVTLKLELMTVDYDYAKRQGNGRHEAQ